MKIVYLGTSGAMPAIDRGLSCTVLALDKEYIMVDCGDGACRQYLKSNLKWNKPLTILVTHMHSDHTVGIIGLLQSMDLMGRTAPVSIYGIKGIKQFVLNLHRGNNVKFGYEFDITEVEDGDFIEGKTFSITCCESDHSIKPSLAYRIALPDKDGELNIDRCIEFGVPRNSPLLGKLKRGENVTLRSSDPKEIPKVVLSDSVVGKPQKGMVICFSGDTRPTDKLKEFYKDADYLTHEASFLEAEKELALKVSHSTAHEAGLIAKQAGVKHTILTHFSARYATTQPIYEEASKVNPNVKCAKDFLEVELD